MTAPHSPSTSKPDWTPGPAKWFAVIILGAACITGMLWSIAFRRPHPRLAEAPRHVEPSATPQAIAPIPTKSPAAPSPAEPTRILDLNSATAAELELLPGIGPSLAQRIVEDRQSRGRFRSVADLDRVKGIGPAIISKIKPRVRVE